MRSSWYGLTDLKLLATEFGLVDDTELPRLLLTASSGLRWEESDMFNGVEQPKTIGTWYGEGKA